MRSLKALLLAAVLAANAGCASLVLGPGSAEQNVDLGLFSLLVNYQPSNLGFGPHTGLSASAQQTLALSLDRVINSVDLTDVTERTVFIPGFSGSLSPEVARRADHNWVAVRLAERVLEVYGRVTFDRRTAQYLLIPWIQMSGGITTHREYRSYGYPIYTHEEDQRPARLVVFLYDKSKRRLEMVEGSRTWQVKIDSYIFGVIPVEWFIGF